MAQHDYVIANGTGAAVRSDLNNALAAIVSNNSGATEPATMYAYQWWADTSTGLLKLRNAANNAWITLRELDGTLTIEDGTASSPGLAFADDLNTGIYSPSADQLGITTGGTVRLTTTTTGITSALPVDVPLGTASAPTVTFTGDLNTGIYSPGADQVAISTGGSGRLFVDSSGRVGVGTSSPSELLHLSGSLPKLKITGTGGTSPSLVLDNASGYKAYIQYNSAGSGNGLQFYDVTNAADRMFLDASGRLGIGTTSPSSQLVVSNGGAAGLEITPLGANSAPTIYSYNRSTSAYIQQNYDASSHVFYIGGSGNERARIDSSGRLLVGTSSSANGKVVVKAASAGENLGAFESSNGGNYGGNGTYKIARFIHGYWGTSQEVASIGFSATSSAAGNGYGYGDIVFHAGSSGNGDAGSTSTERLRISNGGSVGISTTGAQLDILSGAGTSSWGQGIRIGHDATYWAGIRCNGDSNFDRQYLDFWTSRATSAGLIARLTDRFYCNVTTITSLTSERRYKQNIDVQPLIPANCWTVARDLPVRTYEYKDNPGNLTYGPIVDEIEPIDSSLILNTGREDDEGPVRTYDNGRLQAMYQVALQEALKRIEALEAEIAALKAA